MIIPRIIMGVHQSREVPIIRVTDAAFHREVDQVALEEPLEIQISSPADDPAQSARAWKTAAITMRTPGQDRELAIGFLWGERLLRSPAEIETVYTCGARHEEQGPHNRVRVALAPGATIDLERLRRNFYTSSSCGVCGKTSLDLLLLQDYAPVPDAGWTIDSALVRSLPERLRGAQPVFAQTGGLHAAGLFTRDGTALVVREDVGRHNAVDKVIGAQVLAGKVDHAAHILVVSGRASFELVQKAVAAGIPMLVAVGAPSSLAVELAREFGVTLVGFTKPGGCNVYGGNQRIARSPDEAAAPRLAAQSSIG
jgi:FdhD protein